MWETVPLPTFCLKLPYLPWGVSSGLDTLHHMWEQHVGPMLCLLGLFRRFFINLTRQSNWWPADSLFHFPGEDRDEFQAGLGGQPQALLYCLPLSCRKASPAGENPRRGKTSHSLSHLPAITKGQREGSQMPNTLFPLILQLSQLSWHMFASSNVNLEKCSCTQWLLSLLNNWSSLIYVFFLIYILTIPVQVIIHRITLQMIHSRDHIRSIHYAEWLAQNQIWPLE